MHWASSSAAYEQNNLPFFRADIRLLQGRLSEVEREADPARAEVARFLMGCATRVPADALGCVIPRVQILLYLGRNADAWLTTQPEQVYEMIGWEDDRARCQLFRADVASQLGDRDGSGQSLEAATGWILHSGSVEHLCVYHLVRARIAFRAQDFQAAQLAVEEGLHLARRCGLRLYLVELLSVRAEFFLQSSRSRSPPSRRPARPTAMASAPECQFGWGAAEAGHLLGHSLLAQARVVEARAALGRRGRFGSPSAILGSYKRNGCWTRIGCDPPVSHGSDQSTAAGPTGAGARNSRRSIDRSNGSQKRRDRHADHHTDTIRGKVVQFRVAVDDRQQLAQLGQCPECEAAQKDGPDRSSSTK